MDYKAQIDSVLNELMKYSERIRGTYEPVDPQWITRFENEFQIELPLDYKYLLSKTNGFILSSSNFLPCMSLKRKYLFIYLI